MTSEDSSSGLTEGVSSTVSFFVGVTAVGSGTSSTFGSSPVRTTAESESSILSDTPSSEEKKSSRLLFSSADSTSFWISVTIISSEESAE